MIKRLIEACDGRNVLKVMELYPVAVESLLFDREATRRVAQALHAHIRNSRNAQAGVHSLQPFIERLTQDMRSGRLPPHPMANVHLLGIYKEGLRYEEGYAFWQWLSEQDDTYVDQAVYGAAIELLAYRGKDSLPSLESLYVDALKRFPGTFAEYHLSPEAVVPDRSQPISIPGIPIGLLQGILTARILNRDWKNAYLALDTALRLYPTSVPQRFFELFMTERPLVEGYTVFLLACRSGVVLRPNHLTTLLTRLKNNAFGMNSLADRIILLRAQANAVYAYLEAGGSIQGPHMGSFFNSFSGLLALAMPGSDIKYAEDELQIRNTIVTAAHGMTTMLIQSGLTPHPQLFIALLNIAGRFKVRELFDVVMQDIEAARVDIGEIGHRVVLNISGEFRDRDLIDQNWQRLVASAEAAGRQLIEQDWVLFARVCRRAGSADLFEQHLAAMKHAIDTATENTALAELNAEDRTPNVYPYHLMEPAAFESEMAEIQTIIRNVSAVVMAGQPLDLKKTPFSMYLDPQKKPIASEEDARQIYEELTTDPHQPEPVKEEGPKQTRVAMSSTGIPLSELRFQNWLTIATLMQEAEASEAAFQKRLDEAIATGRPLASIRFPTAFRSSDTEQTESESSESILTFRQLVQRLRGPYASGLPQREVPIGMAGTESAKAKASTGTGERPTLRYYVAMKGTHVKPEERPRVRGVGVS